MAVSPLLREGLRKQLWIVLLLWPIDVLAIIALSNFPPLMDLLDALEVHSSGEWYFMLSLLLSAIALIANLAAKVTMDSDRFVNASMLLFFSLADGQLAYWTMLLPATAVLLQFGLIPK